MDFYKCLIASVWSLLAMKAAVGTELNRGKLDGVGRTYVPAESTILSTPDRIPNTATKTKLTSGVGKNNIEQNDISYDKNLKEFSGSNSIPSLISMAFRQSTDKQHPYTKCQLPGLQGNVVRSFQNQGLTLPLDDETWVIELRYNLPRNVANETVVTGVLYSQIEALFQEHENRWLGSGLSVDLEVHEISLQKWNKLVRHSAWRSLTDKVVSSTHHNKPQMRSAGNLLRSILARPYASRRITINHFRVPESTKVLDVTATVDKLRDRLNRRSKFVFLSRVRRESSFVSSGSIGKCQLPLVPQLVLITLDKHHCNGSSAGHSKDDDEFNPFLQRVRRGTSQEKRRRRKDHDVVVTETTGHFAKSDMIKSAVCQRHSMWVRFDDLGWSDWIIAPRAVQAYRCAGECPYPLGASLNSTNHALMMSLMNSVEPEKSTKPCCVPTKLRSVSLLYIDNAKNVVLRQFEDMVIESCGCQ
uniref:TGFbeta-NA1 transforming growth factor beta superfamily signaling ligand n=1 Tax=Phallusia mammillata TaxID=59560 RepID=A0A6F9D878_9ASCI|nr:TGFbeta-NA1 transforming growth factor beta superfamily signaling ligand precursor [Phallusia mammillata]